MQYAHREQCKHAYKWAVGTWPSSFKVWILGSKRRSSFLLWLVEVIVCQWCIDLGAVAGKSTWVEQHIADNPGKRYMVLGFDNVCRSLRVCPDT
jgi:hypothetical protein